MRETGAEDRGPAQGRDSQDHAQARGTHGDRRPAPRWRACGPRSPCRRCARCGQPGDDGRRRDSLTSLATSKVRAACHAGQMPSPMTTAIRATNPSGRTSGSKTAPVEGSAMRASPTGAIGDIATASATAPRAPAMATTRFRAVASATSWRCSTEGGQGGVVLALDPALPSQRLADDEKADQRGEDGQDPPPDGLGMDPSLDGGIHCSALESRHAGAAQRGDVRRNRGRSAAPCRSRTM